MTRVSLDRALDLQESVRTEDGAGGAVQSWQTLGQLWGDVRPKTGRLTKGDAGAVSSRAFRIFVRAAPVGHKGRPIPGQRLVMGTRRFLIAAVTEMSGNALYLVCDTEEEYAA